MKRIPRDAWLLIGLSVLLILLTILAVVGQTQNLEQPPLSAESNQPDGARALRLWLGELGYPVAADPQTQFQIPREATVALILQPTVNASEEELEEIASYIRQGGVLILAGNSPAAALIAEHFEFDLTFNLGSTVGLASQSPLLDSPPQKDEVRGNFQSSLLPKKPEFLVLFAKEGAPVVVSTEVDSGLLIISASAIPFSNKGLQDAGNSQLVLNTISAGGRPDLVWFDEWHHGLRAGLQEATGPVDWLRQSPAGRALLYTAMVIFLSLVLSGRSFGRPLIIQERLLRRPPIEYITAVANLSRRAGHRQAVLADYHYRLKRKLGYRYRLDPRLPDDEFVRSMATHDASVDSSALTDLLARLRHPGLNEAQLIQVAKEASEWIEES